MKSFIYEDFRPQLMSLESIVRSVKNHRSAEKVSFDSFADPALLFITANAAYVKAADMLLDQVSKSTDQYESIAMLGTYTGIAAGLYALNRFAIVPVAKRIRGYHKGEIIRGAKATSLSYVRTATQLALIGTLYCVTNFSATVSNYRSDVMRVVDAFARERVAPDPDRVPGTLGSLMPKDINLSSLQKSDMRSVHGRYLRTYRWHNILSSAERKHGIEQGILAGLVMRESYGNPLELNSSDDGGAGLMMFQPGTALDYGLKVFGGSKAHGVDRNHGRRLRRLVEDKKWDYEALSSLDERFDVVKSSEAAARFLKELHNRHKSWDAALSAYNRGQPAKDPKDTEHVRNVRAFQRYYLEHTKSR